MPQKSYLINFGDSDAGPIGCCCRIMAEDEEDALARFASYVSDHLCGAYEAGSDREAGILYMNFYINPDHITVEEVGEEEDE